MAEALAMPWIIIKRGWRIVTEVHTMYWLFFDVFGALGFPSVVTAVVAWLGEHSIAVLSIVFLLALAFAILVILSILGSAAADPYDQTVRWAMQQIAFSAHQQDVALNELRQAARNGIITIYGRPDSGSLPAGQFYKPIEAIPPDHWRDFDFDITRCIMHEDARECRTVPDDRHSLRHNEVYVDLRVNSKQIKAKWPRPLPDQL
jgi:hypothetical protein